MPYGFATVNRPVIVKSQATLLWWNDASTTITKQWRALLLSKTRSKGQDFTPRRTCLSSVKDSVTYPYVVKNSLKSKDKDNSDQNIYIGLFRR